MGRLSNGAFNRRLRELRDPSTEIPYARDGGRARPTSQAPPGSPPLRGVPAFPTPLAEIGNAIDLACTIRRVSPNGFRNIGPAGAISQFSPGYRNLFDSVWDRVCGDTPNGVPFPVPNADFSGGQCTFKYLVTSTLRRFQGVNCDPVSPSSVNNIVVWGPVFGIRLIQPNPGDFQSTLVQAYCHGFGSSPRLDSPQWIQVGATGNLTPGCPPPELISVTVVPDPPQPDVCGDPPPQYPNDPEPPIPPNLSIDINLGGGNTINRPVNIGFNPDIGININIGDDITINHDGDDIDFNFPGPSLPPSPGGGAKPSPDDTTTDPGNPAPAPPPGNEFEEPPETPVVIRAALVTVTSVGSSQTVLAGEGDDPDNYFPDLGTIKFRCTAADGSSGFTNPIRVQNLRDFVPCPWDGGAIAITDTPRPGVQWVVTPVYDLSGLPTV